MQRMQKSDVGTTSGCESERDGISEPRDDPSGQIYLAQVSVLSNFLLKHFSIMISLGIVVSSAQFVGRFFAARFQKLLTRGICKCRYRFCILKMRIKFSWKH